MMKYSFLSLFAAGVLLGSATGQVARAQDEPAATRGTVKVRSRVFNPFAVGQSRITLNPFGVFTVSDRDPFAGTASATPSTPAVSSPSGSATSSGLVVGSASNNDDVSAPSEIVVFAVRPPFRPPIRSPWRPPPRPPFLPP